MAVSVMTMSHFRAEPRQGHLERLKRMYGYLRKMPDAAIRFRTGIACNEKLFGEAPEYDWMYSVYGNAVEERMKEWPMPKVKMVRTTSFVDANLMHCKVTGKSVTSILHFVNQTPVDWFSKMQGTVETATYGSEFVAARIAVEQIVGLRITLMSMGVPLEKSAWLLGDNQSVITQSTIPSSTFTKQHNALAYHKVQWASASKIMKFLKLDGTENVSDVLSKFLPHASF